MEEEKMAVDPEIFAESTSMDVSELNKMASALGLETRVIDLTELPDFDELYCFIHTGKEKTEGNGGIENHWLALYGKYIFDSYGKYSSYDKPDWVVNVQTIPSALQAYDSNVCGMYAGAFLDHARKVGVKSNPGRSFSNAFNFGKDRKINDTIILDWYKEIV